MDSVLPDFLILIRLNEPQCCSALTWYVGSARIPPRPQMNKIIKQYMLNSEAVIQILLGDLIEERVDAIVNAANAYLQHGGGVAGAISLKGGPIIQAESDLWIEKYGPVNHGKPAYTSAGDLPCKYVIHAVGPVWGEGEEEPKLAEAISGSLVLAESLGLRSIAFPAISTGIFRFPLEKAANIILAEIGLYFHHPRGTSLEKVRMVLFDKTTVETFINNADSMFEDVDISSRFEQIK